jgi:hypothetical protein
VLQVSRQGEVDLQPPSVTRGLSFSHRCQQRGKGVRSKQASVSSQKGSHGSELFSSFIGSFWRWSGNREVTRQCDATQHLICPQQELEKGGETECVENTNFGHLCSWLWLCENHLNQRYCFSGMFREVLFQRETEGCRGLHRSGSIPNKIQQCSPWPGSAKGDLLGVLA